MTDEQTFADYRSRLNIKDVLEDAGYTFYKRDGLRYPAYVRLGSDGKRISGDKYIVMPNKNCCFQPPTIKLYSVTSFIWEHPDLFKEYKNGVPMMYAKNDFHIVFYDASTRRVDETRQFVDYNVSQKVEDIADLQTSQTFTRPEANSVKW